MDLDLSLSRMDADADIGGETPPFARYVPDLDRVEEVAAHHEVGNLVVIGNGGSVTSFRAITAALDAEVSVETVTTMDPDRLDGIASRYDPADTLLMPVSKSGSTVGVIEAFLDLRDHGFPAVAVTSDNNSALRRIVARTEMDWIEHPDIGGRFAGAVETALAPAAVAGIDVRAVRQGAEQAYRVLQDAGNPAAGLAAALYDAEQDGYDTAFVGLYPARLHGFGELVVQLLHETVCKEGEGQTVMAAAGPEFQHHTNQRIFGGKQDIAPVIVRAEHDGRELAVPDGLADVDLRGRDLSDWDGMDLARALDAEAQGVVDALTEQDRPHAIIDLPAVNAETVGELIAFWQYVAVYSARLRGVDPFTQPDVERSKELGFSHRFER
ncbi:MAG: hypothetical protein ABEK12_01625 [Candidatus Nanohaloarchaea archaeon]